MEMPKVSMLAVHLPGPSFKVGVPTKARYEEKLRAAYLLRKVQLQPPTYEELTKEV